MKFDGETVPLCLQKDAAVLFLAYVVLFRCRERMMSCTPGILEHTEQT